jgi:hypothetical protein
MAKRAEDRRKQGVDRQTLETAACEGVPNDQLYPGMLRRTLDDLAAAQAKITENIF